MNLFAARSQMGTSLAFHIIFSVLGVGLPLMLCIAEGLALWHKDATWLVLSRRWAKAFAIIFAIGAVSGAIVEFEITLLWPTFTRFSGSVVGLPFALEGFAFFLEAIFLGIYLFVASRLSPVAHWLCSFPIWISGLLSAWFIVSANSWMNSPAGFRIVNGKVTDINPFQAILNPSTPFETTHMILACYVTSGFAVAAVYAFQMLRGKRDAYHRKGLLLGLAIGAIAIPLQIVSGDFNARLLKEIQPPKYAAMEGLLPSGRGEPLYIGGLVDPKTGQVYYALEIPHGESLITDFDLNSYSQGLLAIPPQNRPNAAVVHLTFDGMVASGFFILFVGLLFWLIYFWNRRRKVPEQNWLLWGIVLTSPAAFIALELGWITTEEGRQPWIIYNYLLVKNAVNPAQWVGVSFFIFSLVYVLLGTTLVLLLFLLARSPLPKMAWNELVIDERVARSESREKGEN
jgi:cytochrome d ubiquinol oxidase subunit I